MSHDHPDVKGRGMGQLKTLSSAWENTWIFFVCEQSFFLREVETLGGIT